MRFIKKCEAQEQFSITQMIYLDVLQGVSAVRQLDPTRRFPGVQTLLLLPDALGIFETSAALCRRARHQGLTIRKSTERLIAAMAPESRAVPVRNNRHFLSLAQVVPELIVFPRSPRTSAH